MEIPAAMRLQRAPDRAVGGTIDNGSFSDAVATSREDHRRAACALAGAGRSLPGRARNNALAGSAVARAGVAWWKVGKKISKFRV
jgi:hypothetical protein